MMNRLTLTTTCPQCDQHIPFDARPQIGQLHTCPHCAELLTVLVSTPLMLDSALERPLILSSHMPHLENRTAYATITQR